MDDHKEHALVVKALRDGLGNCVVWHGKGAQLLRDDPELHGLSPEFILREVVRLVRASADPGSIVKQVPEKREGWRDNYRFYYKVVLPAAGFKDGVFVEMRLTGDDDPDYPEVTLFNAHPHRK